jgi:sugar transferase (PEP-CTERM/EpsH1 system associated)
VPIRIMHVVEAFGVGGGVENGIANLIHGMDGDRFEHVLCGIFHVGSQIERYPLDRVRLICLDQKPRRLAIQAGPLARVIREVRPDIVHSRNWGALEAVAAGRWVRSCAVIHSEHGVEMNPEAEPRRRSWVRRVAFRLAHRVFSVSYQLRDTLARRTGVACSKIGVIHNGVSATRFHRDREAGLRFRAELGVAESDFCIGCVGRLNRIKDYPTLLRAAEVLSRQGDGWRVLIAGQGSDLGALQGLVDGSAQLRGRVLFLGSISRAPEFLNALDVFALPSLCEGISNALLEAMATGLPTVVSAVGGNREVIVEGESGLAFPVGDVEALAGNLARLRREPETRRKLGDGAIQRVKEEFSLKNMVQKYEEMYESLSTGRRIAATGSRRAVCEPVN